MNLFLPEIGDLVYDVATGKIGQAMGHEGRTGNCGRSAGAAGGTRRARSGRRPMPTDAERLSAGVAVANARSRSGL